MNFIGFDVRELDLPAFFNSGKVLYLLFYSAWVLWIWRTKRIRGAWIPTLLGLFCWFLATYPLQRSYGLEAGTDRLRNLWWCATAAAGNPPWESGVVNQWNLEPAWAFLVAALAWFDPARVIVIYPFLPALAIAAMGLSLGLTFYRPPQIDLAEETSRRAVRALWVTFFVLLTPSGPLDYLSPYRGFWQKTFLLKPNHVLALVLVPLLVWLLAGREDKRRGILAALVLAAIGWIFIVPWALVCWGVVVYGIGLVLQRRPRWKTSAIRLSGILLASSILLSPLLLYLIGNFPILNFEVGVYPNDPLQSVWGDRLSSTHSLFFLATLDLGLNFFLAIYGMAAAFRSRDCFQQIWLAMAVSGYMAWSLNAVLLHMGQARGSDDLYYFVVFHTAVFAALGIERLIDAGGRFSILPWDRTRLTAAALLLWFPLSIVWWWDPPGTDPHFRLGLKPIPGQFMSLGQWLRDHSHGSDIVFAGVETAYWIPAIAGRRVTRIGVPEPGTELYRDECALLFPESLDEGRKALEQTGIDYLIFDSSFSTDHLLDDNHMEGHPLFELVHELEPFKIYRALENPGRKP